jgi:O-acetyl-ADP-ribose deacetylase (regulator of RNase III)
MKVILVDIGTSLAESAARIWPEIPVLKNTDMVHIPIMHGTAFVSPANSRGAMGPGAGIDAVYSQAMFPGIEGRVKAAIRSVGVADRVGGSFLPVGQAIKVDDLVVSPTMLLPQKVVGTRNAYLAFNAALWCADREGVTTLFVPGMCTGWGGMSPDDAIKQMKEAYDLYKAGEHHGVPAQQILEEQPKYYENTEFFYIAPEHIVDKS